jgi:nitrous oxidase accessory protein NosD
MIRPSLSSALLLLVAAACNGDKDGGGDTGPGGDGGDGGGDGGVVEDGCILVDGGGGYALLSDALAAASEGSTIELCDGSFAESVTVDKAVTIDGLGVATLEPPVNTSGLTITADGVVVRGLSVVSTRHGVVVDGASDVQLDSLVVEGAGNYAISADDAEGLQITASTLSGNGYGGLEVDGGSVSLSDSVLEANVGYGVVGSGGAALSLSGNTIRGSVYTGTATDGIGLALSDGASATSTGNTYVDNDLVDVYSDGGDLSLEGDTLQGAPYGIFLGLGEVSLTDTTLLDHVVLGAYLYSADPIAVTNVSISTDPKASEWLDIDEWDGSTGAGLVLLSSEVTVDGLSVSGWNNAGLIVADPNSTGGIAVLDGLSISNTGQYGVVAEYMDTTITNSSVTGTRVVEADSETLCYYVNYYAGVYGIYSAFDIDGLSLADNEGWGLSSVYGDLILQNSTLQASGCATVVTYEAALYAAGNTFSGAPAQGALSTNYSTGDTIVGNTFTDNQVTGETTVTYDYMDTYGYSYTYVYGDGYPSASDIGIYGASSVSIQDNVFQDGDTGISLSSTVATVSGNTWSNYRSYPLYASGSEVEFTDNAVDGFQVYGVGCSSGSVEVSDSTFTNGSAQSYAVSYSYDYSDGTSYSGSYTSSNTGYALYASGCDLEVQDSSFSDLAGKGLYLYNYDTTVAVDLVDTDFTRIGTGGSGDQAIYAYVYGGTVDLSLLGVEIEDVSTTNAISLSLTSTSAAMDVVLEDVFVTGAGLAGLSASGITLTMTDTTLSDNGTYGLYLNKSTATVTGSITDGNAYSGVYLDTTTADFNGNTSTMNGTYGMECSTVTLNSCSANELSDNGSGPHSGCDDGCGAF